MRRAVRPEVQALRALAVGAVVLHHGWPAIAPAGYMGVDVFFVLSGFLITWLLLREHRSTGRISLAGFSLRRIRRIMPAAALVLAAVSVMTVLLVPQRDWPESMRELVASALYVENWLLFFHSQDPVHAELDSKPVQHFWSLSVEEQFYLGWPRLLLLSLRLGRRWGRGEQMAPATCWGS
ncbi:acyltransferase family protein [Agromyces sp. NPDC060279]|uniref:acyltransferase family protein n=1 Tax=Agromyces sp. NPDC060279 TaxID=3347092 RepID=UPI0036582448